MPDDPLKPKIEAALERAENREGASNALSLLFPKTENTLRTFLPRESMGSGLRRLRHRISDREYAEVYFRLDPKPSSWSASEVAQILNNDNPSEGLKLFEARIEQAPDSQKPRLRRLFLELLDGAFSNEKRLTSDWLKALIELSPRLIAARDEAGDFFAISNDDRLRYLVVHALKPFAPEERAALLLDVLRSVEDISLLCEVFRTVARDLHPVGATENGNDEYNLGDRTDEVRRKLLARVRQLAKSNKNFWRQANPSAILWFWWGCDLEAEVRKFTSRAMRTKTGLLGLLKAAIGRVRSSSGDYEQVSRKSWDHVVDTEQLAQRASRLLRDSQSSDEEKALADRFLAALERGKDHPF
jgi:hypothetical protein